jgi:hypothetical protein
MFLPDAHSFNRLERSYIFGSRLFGKGEGTGFLGFFLSLAANLLIYSQKGKGSLLPIAKN